jgi:hypothetical protein
MERRIWKWILVGLVAVLAYLFFPVVSDRLMNSWKLSKMETEFDKLDHPPGTVLLAQRSKVGVFGNGNHCDFFVGQIRSYSCSKDLVEEFYERESKKRRSYVEVLFIDDEKTDFLCCYFSRLSDWGISQKPDHNMYLVKLFRNESPNGDMRCH